jgi:hypothetical protein
MKKVAILILAMVFALGFMACGEKVETDKTANQPERPSDADLMAFKVYHHMMYMVTTAKQAGGTNKLLHTKTLPTEGNDPVVTPALDHIYTKVVVVRNTIPFLMKYTPKANIQLYARVKT